MTSEQKEKIDSIAQIVKTKLVDAETGHDWYHVQRVMTNARMIYAKTPCNTFVVELAVLLHDIADPKFFDGDETIGPKMSADIMSRHDVDDQTNDDVVNIIKYMSFKNSISGNQWTSIEMEIVQDADRLDAIGAIGVARAFTYGGYKGRVFYDPTIPPSNQLTKASYTTSTAPTINHFYEKLLLLKDRMNTTEGKRLAQGRHQFLESYLDQFFKEWHGDTSTPRFL